MKKYITLILLLFSIANAYGESDRPEEIIKDTIRLLKQGQPVEAFEKALGSNPFIQKTAIDSAKYKFSEFVSEVGTPHDCEALVSRNIMNRYRIEQYLCLSGLQPFIIEFKFYRPESIWNIQGFSFDSEFEEHIEEDIKREIASMSKIGK